MHPGRTPKRHRAIESYRGSRYQLSQKSYQTWGLQVAKTVGRCLQVGTGWSRCDSFLRVSLSLIRRSGFGPYGAYLCSVNLPADSRSKNLKALSSIPLPVDPHWNPRFLPFLSDRGPSDLSFKLLRQRRHAKLQDWPQRSPHSRRSDTSEESSTSIQIAALVLCQQFLPLASQPHF